MSEKCEPELVDEVLAGSLEAFSVLVRRYQDYAYGVAIGVLSDFELARDVVQEAFLCAFRELRKLQDPARFGGWLRGIVRHTAFRALRELERVHRLADGLAEVASVASSPAPSPVQEAEEAERREIVRAALSRLNEPNREAVSLFYVDGLSYADIAGFLDVTETTVQGRLQRGRAQLRKELLKMVEETYHQEGLPEDFSDEIRRLLDVAAVRGQEHEDAVRRLVEMGPLAVDQLCDTVRDDPRQPVRRAAAAALCRIGDPRALRPVLRVLYTEQDWALEELFRSGHVLSIPGVREELMRILNSGTDADVYQTIQALARVRGDEDVYQALRVFVMDETRQAGLRYHALWAMTRVRPDRAASDLSEFLAVPEVGRTARGCWYFALRDGHRVSIETCLSVLGREAFPIIRVMAGRVILTHGEDGNQVLLQLLSAGTPDERATAALALARDRLARVFGVLLDELVNGYRERKWSRTVASALIANFPEQLLAWSGEPGRDLSVCPALVWALAQLRIRTGQGSADDVLHHGTPGARAVALRELVRAQRQSVLPELRRCLRDGRPRKVAQEAFRQMLRLRDAALPTVLDMLESEHWTERKAAYSLLRRWGKLSEKQQAQGLSDPHIAVRHAARWHPNFFKPHPKWGRPSRQVRDVVQG